MTTVLIRGVAEGDVERATIVAHHAAQALAFLEIHHRSEHERLWPLLTERAALRTELVHRMQTQRRGVASLIHAAIEQLPSWAAAPTRASGEKLAARWSN
jgi:hypothetical protein